MTSRVIFSLACALLLAAPASAQDDSVVRAQALARDGQYDAARADLRAVLQRDPADRDAIAALIDVELAAERPRTAKDLADDALGTAPNDGRFIEGRRRAVDALALLRPWSLSAGSSFEWIETNRSEWREYSAALRRSTRAGPLLLKGTRAERGAVQDDQFEFEFVPRLASGTYLYLSASVAPDKLLFPEQRYAADFYQGVGAGFELSAGFRRLRTAADIDTYVGTVNKYVGKWVISARAFYNPDSDAASARSYHGSVRRYFGEDGASYVGGRYSHGFPREDVRNLNDLEVLDADTVAFDLNAYLGRRVILGASGSTSRQTREGVAERRRNSVSASLGLRF